MNVQISYEPFLYDAQHPNGLVYQIDGLTSPVDAEAAAKVIAAFEATLKADGKK